jgi:hypothetical protein
MSFLGNDSWRDVFFSRRLLVERLFFGAINGGRAPVISEELNWKIREKSRADNIAPPAALAPRGV